MVMNTVDLELLFIGEKGEPWSSTTKKKKKELEFQTYLFEIIVWAVLVPLGKALQWHSRNLLTLETTQKICRVHLGSLNVRMVKLWQSDTSDDSGNFISHNKITLWCLSTKSHQKRKFCLVSSDFLYYFQIFLIKQCNIGSDWIQSTYLLPVW